MVGRLAEFAPFPRYQRHSLRGNARAHAFLTAAPVVGGDGRVRRNHRYPQARERMCLVRALRGPGALRREPRDLILTSFFGEERRDLNVRRLLREINLTRVAAERRPIRQRPSSRADRTARDGDRHDRQARAREG